MKSDFVETVRPPQSWFWLYVFVSPVFFIGALVSPLLWGLDEGQSYRAAFIVFWCVITFWIIVMETRSVTVSIIGADLNIERVNRGVNRSTIDVSKITEISFPELPVDVAARAELVCVHDGGTTVIETRRLSTLVEVLRRKNPALG